MNAADIGPVPDDQRTQSPLDLFLIWAGANIVATTLSVGASLAPYFTLREGIAIMATGSLGGAALIAALAPLGPRLGVPSIVAARAALGLRGAALIAAFMYLMNFAWIAVNNVIAASACASVYGGPGSERAWAVGLGLLATAIVAGGPSLVARTDRIAVPLLLLLSLGLTWACLQLPAPAPPSSAGGLSWLRGLDVVAGYQASWILMFADYSRYIRTERASFVAVYLGLGLTSLWQMPLGFLAAGAAGSPDPGAMLGALGLGWSAGLLMALGTVTTNFVNIYLSGLALRSLWPAIPQGPALWGTGLVGAALSVLSRAWLDRFADFMLLLGGAFVPVAGILLARFFVVRAAVRTADLYDAHGPYAGHAGFSPAAGIAWLAGATVYYAPWALAGTLPSLAAALVVYAALAPRELRGALSATAPGTRRSS
ncbi:MAG: cytosine permease [Vicinamibacteria bacterium]